MERLVEPEVLSEKDPLRVGDVGVEGCHDLDRVSGQPFDREDQEGYSEEERHEVEGPPDHVSYQRYSEKAQYRVGCPFNHVLYELHNLQPSRAFVEIDVSSTRLVL